jgi:hypothetical protein
VARWARVVAHVCTSSKRIHLGRDASISSSHPSLLRRHSGRAVICLCACPCPTLQSVSHKLQHTSSAARTHASPQFKPGDKVFALTPGFWNASPAGMLVA